MTNTFGSLFAGIGGFDLGFERSGMQCKWQVEIDDYATKVLEKHWPHVHRERDIRECGSHNLEPVDVICGGFPCQDISSSGLRKGIDGDRSGLFFEAVRVARELRPRVMVLENVSALLIRGMDRVLGTLAAIGFDAEWHCIPAAAFGAPHLRDRVFVLAYSSSFRPQRVNQSRGGKEIEREDRRLQFTRGNCGVRGWWKVEPGLARVANGIPNRVDRIRALGNSLVPQIAEWIGSRVMAYEESR